MTSSADNRIKLQRNDPCSCGSGRKYKKCCGKEGAATASVKAYAPAPLEIRELAQLYNAGGFSQLEARTFELTRRDPSFGLAWKLMGIALAVQGKDALPALLKAAQLLPADAEVHSNLGNALLKLERMDESVASCRRALQLNPNLAEAHNNLGNALRGLARFDEAASCYRRALQLRPDYVEAHNNLGNSLIDQKLPNDAADSYRRALEINAHYVPAHSNLGNALLKLGQMDESAASCRRALALRPGYAEAHNNLGNALLSLGRYAEAAASYRQALQLRPQYVEAYSNLGSVLLYQDQPEAAIENLQRALDIRPLHIEALNYLGFALRHLGRAEEAAAICEQALRIDPESASTLTVLGELRADQGEFGEAEQLYQRAMALDPHSCEAWSELPRLRRMTQADWEWLAGAQRLASQSLPPRKQAGLQFALGKYFDDLGQFEQAFAHYAQGNDLLKRYSPAYEPARQSAAIDQLMRLMDQSGLQSPPSELSGSERAVFILGMPRSGTTLAEQILASHPQVFGAGELSFWPRAAAGYQARSQQTARSALLSELGHAYLQQLRTLSSDASRVVDKMPANFQFLGLIYAALPQARFIHMQRSPLDTCLSIYFQNFSVVHPYAQDLQDLAHFYAQYQRIMQHWRETLPAGTMLEVPYEGLVEEPEHWSRRMVEFIALSWDARCLDFHQTQRSVTTASLWQVRQKISKASVERWRNYEPFLEPLMHLVT